MLHPANELVASLEPSTKAWAEYHEALNPGAGVVCMWSDGISGCLAVRMYNRTGAPTVKGYLVTPSTAADRSFVYTPVNAADPTGVVLEGGVADGALCWVGKSGLAEVYVFGNAARRNFIRASITADGAAAGQAIAEALPSPPFATDKHFQEAGHAYASRTGSGLVLCSIHFN